MDVEYIVVQAGGKGTRLEHLTRNKPKALVPVENLPMLFHLFRKLPDKQYVVIADYKKEVMREYLSCFASVRHLVVDADGAGTCAGVRRALELIPDGRQFMLVWSDLILPADFDFPETPDNYIGISETFPCRWSYRDGTFAEKRSSEDGVAGLFIFPDKAALADVPESGELVRWMHESGKRFSRIGLAGAREYGLLSEYKMLAQEKCRPFNSMTFDGDIVIKEGIDEQGKKLAKIECDWYDMALSRNVTMIPKIYGTNPLRMERIDGENIYESTLSYTEKKRVLRKLVDALKSLHDIERVPADPFSLQEAYYNKTIDRLRTIRDLVPFADKRTVIVNGRECRNIFFHQRDLEKKLEGLVCDNFAIIHGDCTFSNLMLRANGEPVMIDPRGYFGFSKFYGDPMYDWAKLYYSIKGNYDRFNLKDFRLFIDEKDVRLEIDSNYWEDMEDDFFEMCGADPAAIRLLHAVIWLSLTTYAWQDYDSICGAFYNGLYYLEEVL